jgi:hypothetical protein
VKGTAYACGRAVGEPGGGRGGRALRNGAPQTGSGPDGSSPQRAALCAVGNLTVAPGTRLHEPSGLAGASALAGC